MIAVKRTYSGAQITKIKRFAYPEITADKIDRYENTHIRAGLLISLLSAEKPALSKREPAPDVSV
nr:hypothetical protein [Mucilaginibacter sp. SP1R1]